MSVDVRMYVCVRACICMCLCVRLCVCLIVYVSGGEFAGVYM